MFAKDPQHRVADIRLTGAIWAHDHDDARLELGGGVNAEGFEADEIQATEEQNGYAFSAEC